MLAGMAIYPRSHARDILRAQRDFSQAAPDPVASFIGLMTSPDGDPIVAVPMGYNGPLAEGERLLAPLRAPRDDSVRRHRPESIRRRPENLQL